MGERADINTFFHLIAIEITAKVFVEIVSEAIKNWHYNRPYANVEIKCPDGRIIKITEELLQKLEKLLNENPHLSICEAVNLFNKSAE